MQNITAGLILLILTAGCLSQSEKDAVATLKNVYESSVSYSKGVKTSTGNETIRYFGVSLGNGRFTQMMPAEITAGNAAIYLYKNLSEKDREARTHLAITIRVGEKEVTRMFPMKEMKAPVAQAIVFETFSLNLREGRFEEAAGMVEKQFNKPGQGEALKQYIESFEKENGKLKTNKRLGFGLRTYEGREFFEYNGILIFENEKCLKYAVNTFKEPGNTSVAHYSFDKALVP